MQVREHKSLSRRFTPCESESRRFTPCESAGKGNPAPHLHLSLFSLLSLSHIPPPYRRLRVIFNHDPDIRARLGDIKSARIIAFDENGTALILDNNTGTLRAANTHPDFRGTYTVEWRDQ